MSKHYYRKTNSLCTCCGVNPKSNNCLECESCKNNKIKRQNKLINSRKLNNLCMRCGSSAEIIETARLTKRKYILCKTCYLKYTAYNVFSSASRWRDLFTLWENQKGVCPYTGDTLIFGKASIDHIIPKSRGGTTTIDNLCWTSLEINKMKRDINKNDFILLCKQIVEYRNNSNEENH